MGARAGPQILCAALATAAGFLAFVPTAFSGVAELGLIAGGGMLIAFACTLTFLPAAISLFNPRDEAAEVGFSWARPLDGRIQANHAWLLGGFIAFAALALAVSPRLSFGLQPVAHQKSQHRSNAYLAGPDR